MIMKKINSILSPSRVQPITRCAMACLIVLSVAALDSRAANSVVTSLNDSGAGTLRQAILDANAAPGSPAAITFNINSGGTIMLASMLPVLTNPMGISIDGSNLGNGAITINGGSTTNATGDRIFFVGVNGADGTGLTATPTTPYSIANLFLQNGNARGGSGGSGTFGGGGGAGMGGAIFLNAGNLVVTNVTLSNNRAVGGDGGISIGGSNGNGAGGGMGGKGGDGAATNVGGGGGFGLSAAGGNAASAGAQGGFVGAFGGGTGANGAFGGGANAGGGGGGSVSVQSGGGGGVAGGSGTVGSSGPGGFGGGGGAGTTAGGAAGGFGGGGGAGNNAGSGGFGGGGGATTISGAIGAGGFGGGVGGQTNSSQASGGGGAALGGAIFVRQGAMLTINDTAINGSILTPGNKGTGDNGGGTLPSPGQPIGSAVFLAGNAFYAVSGTITLADTIGGGMSPLIMSGFSKVGPGTLNLTGINTYTGNTVVGGGTLKLSVNGSIANSSIIDIAPGATLDVVGVTGGPNFNGTSFTVVNGQKLQGIGNVAGTLGIATGGKLEPGGIPGGTNPGTLTTGNVVFSAGSTFAVDINGTAPGSNSGYDQLVVNGTVTLGNATLVIANTYTPTYGDNFVIISNNGGPAVSGTFNAMPEGTTFPNFLNSGLTAKISYIGGDGNDVVISMPPPPSGKIDVKGGVGNPIANMSMMPDPMNGTDFGGAQMFGGTAISTFTIDNTGPAQLNLTGTPSITISGTNAGDFVVTAQPTSPLAATNGMTTFDITFTPSALGMRSAMVSIGSDDLSNNPFTFAIQGTGTPSTNANLLDLTLSVGTLNPTFDGSNQPYSTYISDTNTSITVTPTTVNAGATVKVNGTTVVSGTASSPLPISPGPNPVNVVVTAQSGATKAYMITVNAVPQAPTVTTAANASKQYSTSAQNVMLSATVTSSGNPVVSDGTVMFQVKDAGGIPLCSPVTGSVNATGTATAVYMFPGSVIPGNYTIEATFFNAMAFLDSFDNTHHLTIAPATTTTTAAPAFAYFASKSQSVVLGATVSTSDGGVGEGTVTFQILDTNLKPVGSPVTSPPIAAGSGNASAVYVLPGGTEPGMYGIVATFNATSNFASSMDNTQMLTVVADISNTIAASIDTAFLAADHTVELRAIVSVPGEIVNEGTVSFQVFNGGATQIGVTAVSPTVSNGTAMVSFVAPGGTPVGPYMIVATYSGSAHFFTSFDVNHSLRVNPFQQYITSAQSVTGTLGLPFSYQLTANNALVNFDAFGLPPGLSFNPITEQITGIPTAVGTTSATITATDANGTDVETLVISIVTNQAPVITDLSSDDNPALINTQVTYSFTATDADTPTLSYTFNFGDGSPDLTGTFAQGTTVSVSHVYTAYTDVGVAVSLTVTDGFTPVSQTVLQFVPAPASGGGNVPNILVDVPPIVEPLDGLSVKVMASDGGVIQLGIDVSSLTRNAYDVSTDWGDVSGRSNTVKGTHPVHQFRKHGIFVAKSTATNSTTNVVAGTARITLPISSAETGEVVATPSAIKANVANVLSMPRDANTDITTKSIKGKFSFSAKVKDTVTYNGSIKLPAGYDPSVAHEFWVAVGNIVVETTIDKHGKGLAPGTPAVLKTLKISTKIKKGHVAVGGEDARINVTYYSQAMVKSGFDTEGISQQSSDVSKGKSAPRNIQVAMLLDGVPFQALAPVDFSISNNSDFGSISGRSGK